MSAIYLPSCLFKETYPKASEGVCGYLKERHGITTGVCCRPSHKNFSPEDTVIYICNTCGAICREDSPARMISVWEIIDSDPEFDFPDCRNERMTLQDCWKCNDNSKQLDAVRSIMKKMSIDVVEMEENRDKTRFCGTSLYRPLSQQNAAFAPNRFIHQADGLYIPQTEERQKELMNEHCLTIATSKVVCYCVGCTRGIRDGGKQGMHLMDMIFGEAMI